MKKFTKAIAAFCAMAMIFGTFSATVFADETDVAGENVASGEAVDGAQQEEGSDPEDSDDKDSKKADKEAEKAEKQAEKEAVKEAEKAEKEAEKEAKKEAKQEAKLLGAGQDQSGDQAGEQPSTATEEGNGIDTNESVAEPEPVKAPSLFANGLITQDDINANYGKLPVESGTYKLAESITVSDTTSFDVDGAVITLDLNGNNITYTGTAGLFIVGATSGTSVTAAVKLTITDSSSTPGMITATNTTMGNTDHWISCNQNATALTTGTNANRGGCILIRNSSEVILEKVTISNFHAGDDGGAVLASNGSFFTMKSGKITNCSAKVGGGAIAGHAASNGTTVNGMNLVSTIRIEGGEISGNSAKMGSAIRVLRCNYYMTGGVITNNTATDASGEAGGALFISRVKRNPYIEMSGNPQIYGNNCPKDSEKANLYFYDNITIHVVGTLDSSAKIVFSGEKPDSTNFFDISNATYSMSSFVSGFDSNRNNYIAYVSGNYVKLTSAPEVAGASLVIGGEIMLKAFMFLGDFKTADTEVTYSYQYTKGSNATVTKSGSVKGNEVLFDKIQGYSYILIPVESACMTSDITIAINYKLNSTTTETTERTTTVETCARNYIEYLDTNIEEDYSELAKALLAFGYYSQVQMQINTDKLPSVDGIDLTAAPDFGLGTATYTPAADPDGAFAGANVSFLSKTEVKLRFLKSKLGDTAPVMTVTYANGSKTIEGVASGNYYVYTIKDYDEAGFKASKYDVLFSFSVGNVSGEYSIYTYLQVINGTGSQPMKNLAQAYYNFAKEAAKIA